MNSYQVAPNTVFLTVCLRYNCEVLCDERERIKNAMGITIDIRREKIWRTLVDAVGFEALHRNAVRV